MADEVLFEFLHSELVSYVLANSEKDKTVINKCDIYIFCFRFSLSDGLCAENSNSDYWSSVLAR
jgi:hypothetical protein